MIDLKKQIKKIYHDWSYDEYIFEKKGTAGFEGITYKRFIEKSLGIAKYLLESGYKDKSIILLSENSTNLMACDLAITFYVGKSCIICKEWNKEDITESIKEIDADVLICSERYKDVASEIGKEIAIDVLKMENVEEDFSISLLEMPVKEYDETAKIVFSSGTTGKSKGVMLSLRNIFSGLNSLQKRCHLSHDDTAYMFLPMHHTYASVCHFMYSLITGHRIYISSSTSNIARELIEVNPTIFCCVPIVIKNLCDSYKDNIDKAFGNKIRCVICGGAALEKKYRQMFADKNMNLMQTYALTECSSSFTLAYPGCDDFESAGELYEDIDVKIADADKDGIGEITVKGDNVFKGYTDLSLNAIVFDENGYFHTGDLGFIKDNKLYVKGRMKKMLLTSNGENVSAAKIEEKIKSKSDCIKEVKAYTKDDKIGVNIYVGDMDGSVDYQGIIDNYNEMATPYERVAFYRIYENSIESRLKQ